MRIMWIVTQILPCAAEKLNMAPSNMGGWVRSMLNCLKKISGPELAVVMCSGKTKTVTSFVEDGVKYYIIPAVSSNKDVRRQDADAVINDFSPDLIHIEGTEFSMSEVFSEAKTCPVLVSLQGIINGYEPYQYGDLPIADFIFSLSFTKAVTGWGLLLRKKFLFNKRLAIERNTIKNADCITGRTLWDRAHSYVFNPEAKYYSCNRILRPSFYEHAWDYSRCEKHSIFVGNGYSALKGGHTVLEAVRLLSEEFPDVKVVFAGVDPYVHGKKDAKKLVGYSFYLRKLIKKKELKERVSYLGEQNEEQMVRNLLQSNVYVLPSIIENSPNTLGEAMIMGVPCVSAYTGGAAEMAVDNKEALIYRAGDPVMLAYQIKRIFDMKEGVADMCLAAREHARITHDMQKNTETLLQIYRDIIDTYGREGQRQ